MFNLQFDPKCSSRLLRYIVPLELAFVGLDRPCPGMVFDVDDEGAGNGQAKSCRKP